MKSLALLQPSFTRKMAIIDRKSTRLNSSHLVISYAVFCLKKKKNTRDIKPSKYRRDSIWVYGMYALGYVRFVKVVRHRFNVSVVDALVHAVCISFTDVLEM